MYKTDIKSIPAVWKSLKQCLRLSTSHNIQFPSLSDYSSLFQHDHEVAIQVKSNFHRRINRNDFHFLFTIRARYEILSAMLSVLQPPPQCIGRSLPGDDPVPIIKVWVGHQPRGADQVKPRGRPPARSPWWRVVTTGSGTRDDTKYSRCFLYMERKLLFVLWQEIYFPQRIFPTSFCFLAKQVGLLSHISMRVLTVQAKAMND